MNRMLVFAYGLVSYVVSLGVFVYLAGFVGNLVVPNSLDAPREGPLAEAIIVNMLLLAVFGLQHSVMARPTFKLWWTRMVPEPIERSTYLWATNLALILLFWQWRPMGGAIWNVEHPAGRAVLYALYGCGWGTVLATTFLINHFDLFGLRQVWFYLRGKDYVHIGFRSPGPYRYVRHPLYVGWFMVFWCTPTMTVAHLVFAGGMTAYILIAIQFEERNLLAYHGEAYAAYRRTVPMLIPRFGRKLAGTAAPESEGAGPTAVA